MKLLSYADLKSTFIRTDTELREVHTSIPLLRIPQVLSSDSGPEVACPE
jgi:hypothetical protein